VTTPTAPRPPLPTKFAVAEKHTTRFPFWITSSSRTQRRDDEDLAVPTSLPM
jgi:hypothetical protein